MNADRFRQILDAYGADPRRWPQAERADARDFLAANAEARVWLAEADGLDGRLDGWAPLQVSPALRARVLGAAPRPRAPPLFGPWIAGLAATLAAACAAGVVFGVYLAQPALKSAREDAAIMAAMKDLSADGAVTAAPRATDEGEAG
jgi:hypothetical protein